jgi:predicted DNA-binding transcriptional regulator
MKAVWKDDYAPMWMSLTILAFSVGVVASIAVITLRKPGYFRRMKSLLRRGLVSRKIRAPDLGSAIPAPPRVCAKCGAMVAGLAEYCQSCGAPVITGTSTKPDPGLVDDRVYQYIVKRHGEISLSQASADLGIPVDELRRSTERLKRKGRLA